MIQEKTKYGLPIKLHEMKEVYVKAPGKSDLKSSITFYNKYHEIL